MAAGSSGVDPFANRDWSKAESREQFHINVTSEIIEMMEDYSPEDKKMIHACNTDLLVIFDYIVENNYHKVKCIDKFALRVMTAIKKSKKKGAVIMLQFVNSMNEAYQNESMMIDRMY